MEPGRHHFLGYLFRLHGRAIDPLLFMHVVLSSVLAVIAIVLFLPFDTYDTGENWHGIAQRFTEPQFGALCLVVALIGFAGVVSRRNVVQAISATFVCLMHLMIALSFLTSNHAGIGGWLCFALALEALFVARRRVGGA